MSVASKTATKIRILDFDSLFDEGKRKTKASQKSPGNVQFWYLVQKPCGHDSRCRYKKWGQSKTQRYFIYRSSLNGIFKNILPDTS